MGENIYKENRKRQINSFSLLDKCVLLFWNKFYIIARDLRQYVGFYQIHGIYTIKKRTPRIWMELASKLDLWIQDKRQKYTRINRIFIIRIKKETSYQ